MKKAVLVLVITAITAASAAQAEVSVNVQIGVPVYAPPQRVIVPAPPAIHFDVAPLFIAPSRLGFYVGVDTPYDIIFSSDYYYLYYGNSWLSSRHHNGPWVEVPYRELPPGIRRYRIEQIRSYRDREYRVYRDDRDHYRGRNFRPDHEQNGEWKDEHRRDREEWKDEHRRGKEEKRGRNQHDNDNDNDND